MAVIQGQNVQIQGLEELNNLFINLVPEIRNAFHEITGQAAQSMYQEMTSIVPVKTGYLRSTIGVTSSIDAMNIYVTAFYAGFVNYGTRRMKARPFFTGPVERQAPQMIAAYNKAVAAYIAAHVKR
jgi:HK97 gp10 family phage protein